MDYIIVVWNEILWKIPDKGRNLGTSLIIENHISMRNAAWSRQDRVARPQEAVSPRDGGAGGMSTSHEMRGQAVTAWSALDISVPLGPCGL